MPEGGQLAIQATIKRATLAAHRAVEGLDGEAIADLERIYNQAAANIRSRIAQHAGPDGNLALAEMRSALAQVQGELARLAELRDSLLQTSLQRAVNLGVQPYTQAAVQTVDGGMRIATDALEYVRNFIAEDGLQLSDRIWRIDRGARDKVINAIEQAVIQGHSAQQAARELLGRGQGVPGDLQVKINAANATALGRATTDAITKGPGSPMDNAMRLMRTEINRAHGEAYMKGGEGTPGFAGWRYLLSPAHPEPDICDLLSSQNLHGLGAGVYPDRARTPWPAHPNTLSFIVMVFESEITDADRKGKETPLQALARLNAAQQAGVLGKGKLGAFRDGKLSQGMIRAPWKAVKLRLDKAKTRVPLKPAPAPPAKTRRRGPSIDDQIARIRETLANEVDLRGITSKQLQSIAGGMQAVMGPLGSRVGLLRWTPRGANAFGQYVRQRYGHEPGGNDRMEFQRGYVTRHRAIEAGIEKQHNLNRERSIRQLTRAIEYEQSPSAKAALQLKLEEVNVTVRWGVSGSAPDPLFSVAAHEAGHRIYFQRPEVDQVFNDRLRIEKVSRIDIGRVSEYANSNRFELFAEVTALIATGRRTEVPKNILKAYDAAMERLN